MNKFFATILTALAVLISVDLAYSKAPVAKSQRQTTSHQNTPRKQKPRRSAAKSKPTTGNINGYEWVDLGLPSGLKWATQNIGASSPYDYRGYLRWGETSIVTIYDTDNGEWHGKSTSDLQSLGVIDANCNLTSQYDAPQQLWGGSWRLPTTDEITELCTKCTWVWDNGNSNACKGYKVIGPNGKSIFLPAAGVDWSDGLGYAGRYGCYWSSTVSDDDVYSASVLNFDESTFRSSSCYRNNYQSMRPVTK